VNLADLFKNIKDATGKIVKKLTPAAAPKPTNTGTGSPADFPRDDPGSLMSDQSDYAGYSNAEWGEGVDSLLGDTNAAVDDNLAGAYDFNGDYFGDFESFA